MRRIGIGILALIAIILVVALCFDAFDDDDGSQHEASINALAAAGITAGALKE